MRNFRLALLPALSGEVDLVVHGGDLFHRPNADPGLVQMALEPLLEAAEAGAHVALVPGNHERGRIPCPLLSRHPRLHLFHAPGLARLQIRGMQVQVAGFPFVRRVGEADAFGRAVAATGLHHSGAADVRLLAMHQTVEGARVGPRSYTFRPGRDVIRGDELLHGLAAALSGHIHRRQVLTHDLAGAMLPAPVVYAGSVERTAFAERNEPKGYCMLEFTPDAHGGALTRHRFVRLPARPMVLLELDARSRYGEGELRRKLSCLPPDSVVRVNIRGQNPMRPSPFTAARLRQLCPPSMNVDLRVPGQQRSALAS